MMQGFQMSSEQSSQQEGHTRKLLIAAGTWFGLIFGFCFAMFAWGFDAILLSSSSATLAWTKLLLGLPLTVIIGGLVGRLAAMSSSIGVFVIAWAAVGWLFSTLAGHIPFDGNNLTIWFLEPRLRGEIIYAYDSSAEVRTTLATLTIIVIGAFTGFIESYAVNWAWDRVKPGGRLGSASFLALMVSVPMALLIALPVEYLINQPIRRHEQVTGKLIKQTRAGQIDPSSLNYRTISPFTDMLSDEYSVHFVAFGGDEKSWYSAYVDVVFDDGFLLRCATSGENVIYCNDFSAKFEDWMGDLVQAGISGERPWLDEKMQHLAVDAPVLTWLESHGSQMSETYEIEMDYQQNGWIFMLAQFDSGFNMACRFHDAAHIVVDQCAEVVPSAE
jgi:hypothetical protein